MHTLRDRVAVVTGAASGIGRALSIELAREGCDLAICDVDEAGLSETAEEVRRIGRKVCTHRVDVADKARMQRYAAEVVGFHGRVHIVVNNAGVAVTDSFEQHSLEDWEWVVGVNFWGVIYGCKFFLPYLKQADEAHIVNVSSIFGWTGVPLQSSYSATKFAVRGLTDALWVELREHGIGVTGVYPGGVRTNIARSSRSVDPANKAYAVASIERHSIEPAQAAQRIVAGIKKKEVRVLITRLAYLIQSAERLSPTLSRYLASRLYKRWRRPAR
jgi:NAD(P)-dependent dehydrogenase (short-subunit alcohol dehydrogenase family)